MKSNSAPLNLCAPVGVTGTTLDNLPDRRTVWEMRVDGSFLRWCGTLEQFRKDCEEYCDRSKGHWEKVTNTEFRFISPEDPKITHFKAVKKGDESDSPASPVKDTPAIEPVSVMGNVIVIMPDGSRQITGKLAHDLAFSDAWPSVLATVTGKPVLTGDCFFVYEPYPVGKAVLRAAQSTMLLAYSYMSDERVLVYLNGEKTEPEWINLPGVEQLQEEVQPGQKVIWRNAFRWMDDSGAISNHYEMFTASQLANAFGYEVVKDVGYAAIIVDKDYDGAPYCQHCGAKEKMFCKCELPTAPASPVVPVEVPATGIMNMPLHVMSDRRSISDNTGIMIGKVVHRGSETPNPEAFAAFIVTACNSHAAKDAKIRALEESLKNLLPLVEVSGLDEPWNQRLFFVSSAREALALPCA